VVVVGDFNAKTAVLEDFSEPDETFLNVMDVNVEDGLFRYHIAMTTKFYLIIHLGYLKCHICQFLSL
jgi:hypothetical protein